MEQENFKYQKCPKTQNFHHQILWCILAIKFDLLTRFRVEKWNFCVVIIIYSFVLPNPAIAQQIKSIRFLFLQRKRKKIALCLNKLLIRLNVAINFILWMVFANGNNPFTYIQRSQSQCCIYGKWITICWFSMPCWISDSFLWSIQLLQFLLCVKPSAFKDNTVVKWKTTKRRHKSYPFRIITLTWLLFSFVSCYFFFFISLSTSL